MIDIGPDTAAKDLQLLMRLASSPEIAGFIELLKETENSIVTKLREPSLTGNEVSLLRGELIMIENFRDSFDRDKIKSRMQSLEGNIKGAEFLANTAIV